MAKKIGVVISTMNDLHIKVVRPARASEATHALVPVKTPPSPITEAEMRDLFAPCLPVWFNELRDGVMHAADPLQAWRDLEVNPCCRHSVGEAGIPDPELWLSRLDNSLGGSCPDSYEEGLERAARLLARWVAEKYVPQVFVLSAQIVPLPRGDSGSVEVRPISSAEAKELCDGGFISAVGHEGTAQALTVLLGTEVPKQRVVVFLRRGDRAIQFVLRQRQPEGVILDRAAVEKVGYDLTLVTRVN